MEFREWTTRDSQEAFDHAIAVNALGMTRSNGQGPCSWFGYVGDYMYMYSDKEVDYFKHVDTREYVRVHRT
jgi:hypothetical protein